MLNQENFCTNPICVILKESADKEGINVILGDASKVFPKKKVKLNQFMRCFHNRKRSIKQLGTRIQKLCEEINLLKKDCEKEYRKINEGVDEIGEMFYILRDGRSCKATIYALNSWLPEYSVSSTKDELIECLYNLYLIEAYLMKREKFSPLLNISLEGDDTKKFPFIMLNMKRAEAIEKYIREQRRGVQDEVECEEDVQDRVNPGLLEKAISNMVHLPERMSLPETFTPKPIALSEALEVCENQEQEFNRVKEEEKRLFEEKKMMQEKFYQEFKQKVVEEIRFHEKKTTEELIELIEKKKKIIVQTFEDLRTREKLYNEFGLIGRKLEILSKFLKEGSGDSDWIDNYFKEQREIAEGSKIITRKNEISFLEKQIQRFKEEEIDYRFEISLEEYEETVSWVNVNHEFKSIFRDELTVQQSKEKLEEDFTYTFNNDSTKEELLLAFGCILRKRLKILKKERFKRFNRYRRFTRVAEAEYLEATLEKRIKYHKQNSSKKTMLNLVKNEEKWEEHDFKDLAKKEYLYNKKSKLSNLVEELKKSYEKENKLGS